MSLDYPVIIKETEKELIKLERKHRYSHLSYRVKLLRLLKSGSCTTLTKAAEALGYSYRHCHRWFSSYR